MHDLREYSLGDWFRLFVRALPAFLLAVLVVLGPIVVLAALAWLMVSF